MRRFPLSLAFFLVLAVAPTAPAQRSGGGPAPSPAAFSITQQVSFLTQASVREELKLTPEQISSIEEALTSYRATWSRAFDRSLSQEARLAEATKMAQEYRSKALETLNDQQKARFQQIVRQQQRKSGLAGLVRTEEMQKELKLLDGQMTEIQSIQTDFTNQRNTLSREERATGSTKHQELLAAADEKVTKVLSAEQNAQVKELLGPAFTGEIRTGFSSTTTEGRFRSDLSRSSTPSSLLRSVAKPLGTLTEPAIGLLGNSDTRNELKLTDEQSRKASAIPALGRDDPAPSLDFLTAEQRERLNQLTLQYAALRFGPLGPLYYARTLEALALSEEQRKTIATIAEEDRKAFDGPGNGSRTQRIAALNRQTEEKLTKALTEDQQKKFKALLGEPYSGTLSVSPFSARSAFESQSSTFSQRAASVGTFGRTPWSYLSQADVQSDLKLTDEQKQKMPNPSQFRGGTRQEEEYKAILTEAQTKRLWQIQLQYIRQRSGAAYVFRYVDVVDALQLTDEQKQKLLPLVQAAVTARSTSDPTPDRSKEVDEILTEPQKTKLKEMLGEPFQGKIELPSFRGPGGGSGAPAGSGTGTTPQP